MVSVEEKAGLDLVRYGINGDERKKPWDRLRSHASLTAPGGDPILYGVTTDDIQFWALSLALKYRF